MATDAPILSGAVPIVPAVSSPLPKDGRREPSLIKSLTFLDGTAMESYENMSSWRKLYRVKKWASSTNISSGSSLLPMNQCDRRKPDTLLPTPSEDHQTSVLQGSAMKVQQRVRANQAWQRQKTKSQATMAANSAFRQATPESSQ